jgi:hypothetical protein
MHPINSVGRLPTKTKIVTALPSYIRQRLSDIRRGWCPSRTLKTKGRVRVVRSDASEAHRLSLSARVLSARDGQVKAKQQVKCREEAPAPQAKIAPAPCSARASSPPRAPCLKEENSNYTRMLILKYASMNCFCQTCNRRQRLGGSSRRFQSSSSSSSSS